MTLVSFIFCEKQRFPFRVASKEGECFCCPETTKNPRIHDARESSTASRARTCDLVHVKDALSQLSYDRPFCADHLRGMLQKKGLEPSRHCCHRHLKPARLPIPPLLRTNNQDYMQIALPCQYASLRFVAVSFFSSSPSFFFDPSFRPVTLSRPAGVRAAASLCLYRDGNHVALLLCIAICNILCCVLRKLA